MLILETAAKRDHGKACGRSVLREDEIMRKRKVIQGTVDADSVILETICGN